jgi:uracil-DNA glycosylase
MNNITNDINNNWLTFFEENKTEIEHIMNSIDFETQNIYPYKKDIFRALFYFPPEEIKLVIIGQDPYISYEMIDNLKIPQACGLSFSVPECHKKIPPSLKNIFKEIKNCYNDFVIPKNGCLQRWVTDENILLLNSSLTVIEGKSNSHRLLWSKFTNKLIEFISSKNVSTIFLLMGNDAHKKEELIDITKHKIFKTVHPSPLSASRGFFGCNVFKLINDYLINKNQEPINW